MNQQPSFEVAELNRRMAGLVRFCKVIELGKDENLGRVRVSDGQLTSGWLVQAVPRAADNNSWQPLDINEYVVVICPNGDFAQGVIVGSLYQSAFSPPNDNPDIASKHYKDGSVISFDRANSKLHIVMATDGTIHIEVSGGATIDGPITVNGDVSIDGELSTTKDITTQQSVTAATEVTAGQIKLTKHLHSGVSTGKAKTLKPE